MFSHILSCLNITQTLRGIEKHTIFWKLAWNPLKFPEPKQGKENINRTCSYFEN